MRSALEQRLTDKREKAEAVVAKEHNAKVAEESLFSFSDLDCICDVRLGDNDWIRYVFIEGEGGEDDELRRIG